MKALVLLALISVVSCMRYTQYDSGAYGPPSDYDNSRFAEVGAEPAAAAAPTTTEPVPVPTSVPEPPAVNTPPPPPPAAATPAAPIPNVQPTVTIPAPTVEAPAALKNVIVAKKEATIIQLPPEPIIAPQQTQEETVVMDETDPETQKLNVALEAVREDITVVARQIREEKKWVGEVRKITSQYEEKMKRVEGHIAELRKQIKTLYHKKKQLENLKLQKALEAKLKEAQEELSALEQSIGNVKKKKDALSRSKAELNATVKTIEEQLKKLQGEEKRDAKDGAVADANKAEEEAAKKLEEIQMVEAEKTIEEEVAEKEKTM